jgi:drug/metabolite transporter (DMT)-like permease
MPARLSAALVMILWASCYPLITIGLESAPHLTFAVMRAAIAGLSLIALALLLRQHMPRDWATWGWITLAGLGMTGLGYYGMFHAAEFVAPGLATVVANSQPLIAAVLAFLLLQERLSPRSWIGLGIGFLGIVVIAAPQVFSGESSSSATGLFYVLLAAFGVAVGNIAIKKLSKQVDAAVAMGLQLLIGAVPLAIIAALTEEPATVDWSARFIGSLVGLSIPGTAIAFWLWQYTLGKMELSKANVFSFLVPVFGLSIGITVFGERVTPLIVLGTAIATGGVLLTTARSPKDAGGARAGREAAAPALPRE